MKKLTSGLKFWLCRYRIAAKNHFWQKRVQFSKGTCIWFFTVLVLHFEAWPHMFDSILMCVVASANTISGWGLS